MADQSKRNRYVELALSYIPHLTQLVDKNQYSPTYGCFDREYWHYRTLDFPCGMSQEFVLPFAMLYANEYPGNKYYQWPRMKELAIAGIRFAAKASHSDGTCDDYFPYERAMGALVFSLYACTEAYQILELDDPELVTFFRKRGDHLITTNETGQLSNHQAFAALSLYNVYLITKDERYKKASLERQQLTISWQNEEGWFQEYEGADPGYHSCSIAFLGKLFQKNKDESLIEPLKKAVDFAWHFMHPDGSYAGEYGSRNTYHFYPHGFEIMAPYSEKAAQIADAFLGGLPEDRRYHNDDDRMCCHCVYDWLQSWADHQEERPAPINTRPNMLKHYENGGMVIAKTDAYYAITNLRKGGVFKVYSETECVDSDTGIIGELEDGNVVVAHLMDAENKITTDVEKREFSVEGVLSYRRAKLSSPFKVVLFRVFLMTFGRFIPNVTRSIIQKLLITYKTRTSYRFKRSFKFTDTGIKVVDELPDAVPFKRVSIGTDATSIYVANSNVFQESVLRVPWKNPPESFLADARKGGAKWERVAGGNAS